jgi:hypothetical protein
MAKRSEAEKYTDSDLRDRSRRRSRSLTRAARRASGARKSQLLTREREKRGGGYRGEKDKSQKNLDRWTGEE